MHRVPNQINLRHQRRVKPPVGLVQELLELHPQLGLIKEIWRPLTKRGSGDALETEKFNALASAESMLSSILAIDILGSNNSITSTEKRLEAQRLYEGVSDIMKTVNLGQFVTSHKPCNDAYCQLQDLKGRAAQRCLPVAWALAHFKSSTTAANFVDTQSQPPREVAARPPPARRHDVNNVLNITKSLQTSTAALGTAMVRCVDKANERYLRICEIDSSVTVADSAATPTANSDDLDDDIAQLSLELALKMEQRSRIQGSRSKAPTSRFFGLLSCADGHVHIFKSGIDDEDLSVLQPVTHACLSSSLNHRSKRNVNTRKFHGKHHIPEV